jgi:hypothetical protein
MDCCSICSGSIMRCPYLATVSCLALSDLLWEAAHRLGSPTDLGGIAERGLLFAQSGTKLGLQRVAGLAGCSPP